MARFFRKYVAVVLVSATLGSAACSGSEPAGLAAPSPVAAATVKAEPVAIRPEFLPATSCFSRPPFRGGLVVIVGSTDDLILRGLQFNFTDRLGTRTSPLVSPAAAFSTATTSIPVSGPIPIPAPGFVAIPGSSAITIPGSAPVHGVFLPANTSRQLAFDFEFGCGVLAEGSLVITVETTDRNGRRGASDVRVSVGG